MGQHSFKAMGEMEAGTRLGTSSWFTVDQDTINSFARTTGDEQWIHVDVERAKRESPFGGPVAHGYLTLSLLAGLAGEIDVAPPGTAAAVNYGLDKVRFLAPVPSGARVRSQMDLVSFEDKGNRSYLMAADCTVEIEGHDKPALVARTLTMFVAGPDAEV